jgi:hypothetical protein
MPTKPGTFSHDFLASSMWPPIFELDVPSFFTSFKHFAYFLFATIIGSVIVAGVADPDLNVFGPPGSGSFYHQAKIVRKTLTS